MKEMLINTGTANIYEGPTYKSQLVTQGILWERVIVLQRETNFSLVRLSDSYEGWISNYQLVPESIQLTETVSIRSHLASIYSLPDESALILRDAVIGCRLPVKERKSGWFTVVLPDGTEGYLAEIDTGDFPELSRTNILKLAKEFLGIPYFWGGKSPKGLDCSGLTQLTFNLLGGNLPRDSWMQRRDLKQIDRSPRTAEAGDLLFFGEDREKVDHVGISLGNEKIIHARGMVRINSFSPNDTEFSERLVNTFISAASLF